MDKEEATIKQQELEKLSVLIEKPLNNNIGNSTDPEQLIEYLVEDSMNIRRYSARLVEVARFFNAHFENSQIKIKELKKRNNYLTSKLEESSNSLDMTEKTLLNSEERIEYLTRENEELEKNLSDNIKEKERLKKDLSVYKKALKEKEAQDLTQTKTEKLSISYIKEESSKKISELNSELSKKMQTIENLTQVIKSYENKLANEKNNSEQLRAQNSNLKNDLHTLNSKLSDMKTKCFSYKEKIKDLEATIDDLNKQYNEMSKTLKELKEKEKSFTEIETEEQTIDVSGKKPKGKTEALDDFYVTEEIGELEEYETEGEGLVYFITNPGFEYPRMYNLSVDCGEAINILSPKAQLGKKFEFPQESPEETSEISEEISESRFIDYEIDNGYNVLGFKEPVKQYFIKIVQEAKLKSPFKDQLLKVPTNQLYSDLIKNKTAMSYWPDHIVKYLTSKAAY